MNYSILLSISKPEEEDELELWTSLKPIFARLSRKNKDVELIGEYVLLIQLNTSLASLVRILSEIESLDYKYTILNEEIEWHEVVSKNKN